MFGHRSIAWHSQCERAFVQDRASASYEVMFVQCLPSVAFDPGACGCSGIGPLLGIRSAKEHSCKIVQVQVLKLCLFNDSHQWPLTPELAGVRASVHCLAFSSASSMSRVEFHCDKPVAGT